MGARMEVLEVVSGWQAVELVLKCFFLGIWQLLQISVKRIWKGHRRKASDSREVELTVDSSFGRHCYIKIMGVKYHYVETGPKSGHRVVVLRDAPETEELWTDSWAALVRRLAAGGLRVLTLELRGCGASEGGPRARLAPPSAVAELALIMEALGVSAHDPATIIGFGIGGMLAWYVAHCRAALVRRLVVVGAPHPSLYWRHPPARFCRGALYFLQWPWLPERWLAREAGGGSRARDWVGALHYVRGAAWWRVRADAGPVAAPALLVGGAGAAPELVASAQYCAAPALRLLAAARPAPQDPQLAALLLDFLRPLPAEAAAAAAGAAAGAGAGAGAPRAGLVGRVLGAVAGRGRELTARLALPRPAPAPAPAPAPLLPSE